jgi:Family of unknown function (DUF6496)
MRHMRENKHPAKNRKQAIAVGLAMARRKGEKVPSPPSPGRRAA